MQKILIADELSFCRQLLSFALRQNGYEVVAADDGLMVIDAIKREKPTLVILEARLPKIDGLGVLRVIRSSPDYRQLPVFILTASENRQHIVQAVQIGVQEYILKSQFDLEALLGRVHKCIGRAEIPAGGGPPSTVEEIWDHVETPATAGAAIEIPGDMEEAVSTPRSHA